MSLTRRDVIKAGVFAGAAMSMPLSRVVSGQSALTNRMAASKLPRPFTLPFRSPPVAKRVRYDATTNTEYYVINMEQGLGDILPGFKTMVFAYNGSVPGPTFKIKQGCKTVVRFRNMLPNTHPTLGYEPWTSIHLHGSASLPQYDGYANDITRPGQFKDYHYPNWQNARTLWYHDHGVHHTAENVYHGLLGQYQLSDKWEQSLPIPHEPYDFPLILGDAMFNNDGSLLFSLENESGLWGDVILANGVPWPFMQVERRKYRFRILGATVARSWKLSLDSGEPMTIIGSDGGLTPKPQPVTSFRMSGGERYEVVIDFAKYPVGRRVILRNGSLKNNVSYDNTDKIMAFDVIGDAKDLSNNSIPDALTPNDPAMAMQNNPVMALQERDSKRTRNFQLKREHGQWTINGGTWEDVIDSKFQLTDADPRRGDVEIWEFENSSGGWFHPAHMHFVDFKVLDRNGKPPFPHELAPKDVVYVGEGEKVRVITKFDGLGKYMTHCHNTIHEDHDMMGQYEITDPQEKGDDPLGTPAIDLSEESSHPL
jgi:FtsP/CotA-like multicopper oxidase with cupredoxin domain